jgi:hypothetical protein
MVRIHLPTHAFNRTALLRRAHVAGLLVLIVGVFTVCERDGFTQCMTLDAHGKRIQATLAQSYKPALLFQSSMEKRALEREQDGGDGAMYRNILRLQLNLTEEQFAPFQGAAMRFARAEADMTAGIQKTETADRAQHPQSRELSEAAKQRIHDIFAEIDRALSEAVESIHLSLDSLISERLDKAVEAFCTESEATQPNR